MAWPVHGGLNYAELRSLGLVPGNVLDFSANINPLGTAPGVQQAIRSVDPAGYPDPGCLELREALGMRLDVAPDNILVGNGSTELLHLLARACLTPGAGAAIFTPGFGEYETACHVQGVAAVCIRATPEEGFHWDLPGALDRLAAVQPSLVFLGNPNNPTGHYLGAGAVGQLAEVISDAGLLVLDEAYLSFVEQCWDSRSLLDRGNVVLLRSMTKDHALAGLRLGYLLAAPETLERIAGFQYSWSVNALAQAAGVAALEHYHHVVAGREVARSSKKFLQVELRSLGLECTPSAANFLLVKVGNAAGLRNELLTSHGICVRDCTSFGLPEYIRVGVRRLEECRRLISALEHLTAGLRKYQTISDAIQVVPDDTR